MFKPKEFVVEVSNGYDYSHWDKLPEVNSDVLKEHNIYPILLNILKIIKEEYKLSFGLWSDQNNDRKDTYSVPDIVLYRGESWDPSKKEDRNNVIVDIEIKKRYNPKSKKNGIFTTQNSKIGYDGDFSTGYRQLLQRSSEAFSHPQSQLQEYNCVITDLEHITFFKIKKIEASMAVYFDGNHKLVGKWNSGNHFSFSAKTESVSKGFEKLINFIIISMKANALPSLLIFNDNESDSKSYQIKRILGKGRKSIVFAATNENDTEVCVKLEPITEAAQLKNEEIILNRLKDCKGVPKLTFSGKTTYLGEKYYAVVTDVVGEYNLQDLQNEDDISLQKIIIRCLDTLKKVHSKGIVHRDIKPQHIIFCKGDPYIIDFGASGEPKSPALFTTPEFSPATTDYMTLNEKGDFESFWYSVLSLRQRLPWINTLNNSNMTMSLKFQHSPECMKNVYPKLATPFLINDQAPNTSMKKRKHDSQSKRKAKKQKLHQLRLSNPGSPLL